MLQACDKGLFYTIENYISLPNSKIEILPNNSFEFITMILNEINKSPYKDSLLESLQFIYQKYLYYL